MKTLIIYIYIIYFIIHIFTQECKGEFAGINFDLSAYVSDFYHEILDTSSIGGHKSNYSYYFNFCKESLYPRQAYDDCFRTGSDDYGWSMESALAFRHDNLNGHCNRLSGAPNHTNWMFGPLDVANLAIGVTFAMIRGDTTCFFYQDGKCMGTSPLSFHISIRCIDVLNPIPSQIHVSHPAGNIYGMELFSSVGCPVECPIVGGKVCQGHGTCYYDTQISKPRCFCNRGYIGDSCGKKGESTVFTSSTTGFMILTIVLLVVVIAFVAYIFYRLRKVNINPDSYESLENRFNQLGQLAG